ncbi:DUF7117 family protein [Haloarchaeobius litoreus]|uniref:TFIIB-type zinc ribbon-containing protein n=1 Tax=Haloarchaeobius litoreus TaxID=755306 RepID=A0ABD6DIS6_9EURY|nr:TFIIB-type zinc ribbon-containing protein [Haloarchaeobius litoreus]
MEIRGERECKDCGTRWSYYETGSVSCPECGSLHSVGVDDDRKLHTTQSVEFDLTEARERFENEPEDEALKSVAETVRTYQRKRGFVAAGELRDLDDDYLVAGELRHVADLVDRSFDPDDDEEWYLLRLLRGDTQGRPEPADVPDSLREARGLAAADAVREYRRELRDWLAANDVEPDRPATKLLASLDERVKRVRALEGDVPPREADALVEALREVVAYVKDGDEVALSRAQDRLADD